jgi:hypothetical protein
VSGRDPRGVEAHETARESAQALRKREKQLAAELNRLRQQRVRVVGAHASQRGRERGQLRVYRVGEREFATRLAADAFRKDNPGSPPMRVLAKTRRETARMGELNRLDRLIANRVQDRRTVLRETRKSEHTVRRTPLPDAQEGLRGPGGIRRCDRARGSECVLRPSLHAQEPPSGPTYGNARNDPRRLSMVPVRTPQYVTLPFG